MEIWKDIEGFESKYEVSNFGRIRNKNKLNILKPWINTRGYESVTFQVNGKGKSFKVHKLVAIAFLNHIPNGMNEVIDHLDGNRLNNNVENLHVTNQHKNASKKHKNGTYSKYVGVSYNKRDNKWISHIRENNRQLFLKSSRCELSCAYAYNMKFKEIQNAKEGTNR